MPNVADLLSLESETVDLEPGNFERLLRRRDRKRRNQRIGAGALAVVVSLFAMAVLLSAYRSERLPADRSIEPSPSTERVGFVGLPPEGARASTPPSGEMVLSSNGFGAKGVRVDLYVYADGTMIWQKWGSSSVPVGVPEGANEFITGYLEQRLTTEGVELLRSRILSTGLFEHDLELRAGSHHPALTIGVRKGNRVVLVSAFQAPDHTAIAQETQAQARALVRLEALLADPGGWLPTTAWADREIRAYVASRYGGGFDRRVPSPSELPPPAAELIFGRADCRDFTVEEVRTVSKALDDAGISPSIGADGELGFVIADPQAERSWESYLHFWPVLPHRSTFQHWGKGLPPGC